MHIAGITVHPDERWMQQIARNVTMEGCGALRDCRYLLHDRDTKYSQSFRAIIASGRVEPLVLPARSPKRDRRDYEQIHRRNAVRMVAQKGLPALRRWSPSPGHVFCHGGVCTENLIRIDCVTESPRRQRR
jgi:hypothetical protein